MINFQQSEPNSPGEAPSGAPSAATEDRPPEIKGKEIGKMLAAKPLPFGRCFIPSRQKQISKDK